MNDALVERILLARNQIEVFPHVANMAQEIIMELCWEVLPHSVYSSICHAKMMTDPYNISYLVNIFKISKRFIG